MNEESIHLSNFYQDKNVLVTGHTGFKGTWLSIWLKSLGANVIGYALEPNTDPSIFKVTQLENEVISIIGDLRNERRLLKVIQTYQPELIFHLGAQTLVRLSYQNPRLTYETNIMGVVNLFEATRRTESIKAIVNVTSDKCYENNEWVWGYRENDAMGGYDPYSSSKGCSELITSAYRRSFFKNKVSVASARAGNVIGGGDWAEDRILPDCIRALTKNDQILIRNPQSRRPWQFITEPISGYLWLGVLLSAYGEKYASGWNFGPNASQVITVRNLTDLIIHYWGDGAWISEDNTLDQPHEAKYLKLDVSKANDLLNWYELYEINKSISETVNWYKEYYNQNNDMYGLCIKQIEEYIQIAKKRKLNWTFSLSF